MKTDDTRKLDEILLELDEKREKKQESDYDREERLNEYIKGKLS